MPKKTPLKPVAFNVDLSDGQDGLLQFDFAVAFLSHILYMRGCLSSLLNPSSSSSSSSSIAAAAVAASSSSLPKKMKPRERAQHRKLAKMNQSFATMFVDLKVLFKDYFPVQSLCIILAATPSSPGESYFLHFNNNYLSSVNANNVKEDRSTSAVPVQDPAQALSSSDKQKQLRVLVRTLITNWSIMPLAPAHRTSVYVAVKPLLINDKEDIICMNLPFFSAREAFKVRSKKKGMPQMHAIIHTRTKPDQSAMKGFSSSSPSPSDQNEDSSSSSSFTTIAESMLEPSFWFVSKRGIKVVKDDT